MGGYSAGAFISWEYAIKHPNKVTAILPLAGAIFPQVQENICDAKEVSVWAFHGLEDQSVNVTKAQSAIKEFNLCKPKTRARLTVFDGVEHGSHQQVLELEGMHNYSALGDPFNENIYRWLMSQSLASN